MIALLTGNIAYRSIDHLIVDVGGVGYRLQIPLSTFYTLPEAGPVQFHVYTNVREDAIHLYGFLTPEEKDLFVLLISVSGIGPKLAINILSHIPAASLRAALADGDTKRLATLPGIGNKTAERLVLELKDKIRKLEILPARKAAGAGPQNATANPATPMEDILSALVNLGYKESLARRVLETLEVAPDSPLEEILKGALKILVK
jgi:Holliday junction DNA helicase RuvA